MYSVEHATDSVAITSLTQRVHILFDNLIGIVENQDSFIVTHCPKKKNGNRCVANHAFPKTPNVASAMSILERHLPEQGHFLVLINPASGCGMAESIWRDALPLFTAAKCTHQAIVTRHPGNAREIVKNYSLSNVKAIIIVSGDGLVLEAIQGLECAGASVPLAQLPAGSGNALSCSLLYETGEKPTCLHSSVLMIIRGKPAPMDVFKVDSGDNSTRAFLSLTCGIIGDVDAESEHFRWLGGLRFPLVVVWRSIFLRTYTTELYYLPPGGTTPLPPLSVPLPPQFERIKLTRCVGINVFNLAMISSDCIAQPTARRADGILHIVILNMRGPLQTIQAILGFPSGSHVNRPDVAVIPCVAFRFLPQKLPRGNNLMVDGERIPFGPVQGSILPSAGLVLTR